MPQIGTRFGRVVLCFGELSPNQTQAVQQVEGERAGARSYAKIIGATSAAPKLTELCGESWAAPWESLSELICGNDM